MLTTFRESRFLHTRIVTLALAAPLTFFVASAFAQNTTSSTPMQPNSASPVSSTPAPGSPAPAPAPTPVPIPTPASQPASAPPSAGAPTAFTTPDGTASVSVTAGWTATGGEGLITMTGAQPGESALLGKVTGAHNGPFNPNAAGSDNTGLDMPYAADFHDKVGMLVERLQVIGGRPVPQDGSVTSVSPIPAPRDLGQCGRFSGNMTSPSGNVVLTGALCVMPLENDGDYKTVLLLVQAPTSESATLPQLAQQIFTSYNVPINYLQTLLKPWNQIAGRPVIIMNPTSTQCFELSVMHSTPASQWPRACGGMAP